MNPTQKMIQELKQRSKSEHVESRKKALLVVCTMLDYYLCGVESKLVTSVETRDWAQVGLFFKDLANGNNVVEHTACRISCTDWKRKFEVQCMDQIHATAAELCSVGHAPILKRVPDWSLLPAARTVVSVLFGLILLVCMAAVVYLGWQAVSWESKPADPSDKERLAALEGNITALCGTVVELKEEVQALRASYATREQIRDEQFQKVLANVEAEGRNAVSEAVKEVVKKAQIQEKLIKDLQTRTITADELVSRLQTRFNKSDGDVTALHDSVKNVATQVKPLMERLAEARKEAGDVQGNLDNTKEGVERLTTEVALVLNDWSNSYNFRIGYAAFLGLSMAAVMLWEDHVVRRHRDDPFKLKTSHEIAGLKGRVSILESIIEALQSKGQRARQPGPPGGPH